MDTTLSSEKHTVMLRYSRLRTITTLLRCIELLAIAILVLWSSSYIPTLLRSSGDLLRQLIPILLGPKFLFLIGNAIIVTLLYKSRHLTSTPTVDDTSIGDEISAFVAAPPPQETAEAVTPPVVEEVVFEDKRVTMCVERDQNPPKQAYKRSKSQKVAVGKRSEAAELRRAETDVGKVKEEEDPEEFRRMIEAFIKKQWKFQREESMAIVCANGLTAASAGTVEQVK